jgi:predicted dehydrogenase
VYCLNAARQIFAAEPIEAVAVKSSGNGSAVVGEVEESIAVTLRFPKGQLAQFLVSFGAESRPRNQINPSSQ